MRRPALLSMALTDCCCRRDRGIPADEPIQDAILHFRTLSSGSYHPAASRRYMEAGPNSGAPIRLQIYESVVGFTWNNPEHGTIVFDVWNWKDGRQLWVCTIYDTLDMR